MRRIVDPATTFVPAAERVFERPVEIAGSIEDALRGARETVDG